jgi:acetylglutamate kinase
VTDSPITVVKVGGSTLGRHDTSLDDIAALHAGGMRFVVVHGGGATISEWLEKHDVESRFVRGLRATDERALDVVVAVLAGLVNKRLVAELQARGARALGMSGADHAVMRARRYDPELGFVGQITGVDADALRTVVDGGAVAVLAPIAIEIEGGALRPQLLNVNADTVAGDVAAALEAERLVFLTDVPGVLDAEGAAWPELSAAEAGELLKGGAVTGGMIPKLEAALAAAAAGVPTCVVDGREAGVLRALLDEERSDASVGGTRIG